MFLPVQEISERMESMEILLSDGSTLGEMQIKRDMNAESDRRLAMHPEVCVNVYCHACYHESTFKSLMCFNVGGCGSHLFAHCCPHVKAP
jgi:hypothetical protein